MDISKIDHQTIQSGPDDIVVINIPEHAYVTDEELDSLRDAFRGRVVVFLPPEAKIQSLGPEALRSMGLTRLQ